MATIAWRINAKQPRRKVEDRHQTSDEPNKTQLFSRRKSPSQLKKQQHKHCNISPLAILHCISAFLTSSEGKNAQCDEKPVEKKREEIQYPNSDHVFRNIYFYRLSIRFLDFHLPNLTTRSQQFRSPSKRTSGNSKEGLTGFTWKPFVQFPSWF